MDPWKLLGWVIIAMIATILACTLAGIALAFAN